MPKSKPASLKTVSKSKTPTKKKKGVSAKGKSNSKKKKPSLVLSDKGKADKDASPPVIIKTFKEDFYASYKKVYQVFDSLTHALAAMAGVVGLVLIILRAAKFGDAQSIVAAVIFGVSLIILFSTSAVYHGLAHTRHAISMQRLDHISIYILIAGTYTFFTLSAIRGSLGWALFGIIWGMAIGGTIFKILTIHRQRNWHKAVSLILYIVMGWMMVFAAKPLADAVNSTVFKLIFAGGISYTGGVAFFLWEKLPFSHAIWHLFVIAGAVLHYLAAYLSLN